LFAGLRPAPPRRAFALSTPTTGERSLERENDALLPYSSDMGGRVQEKCTSFLYYKIFKSVIARQKKEAEVFFVKLLNSFL
jgi:hypothetical protein